MMCKGCGLKEVLEECPCFPYCTDCLTKDEVPVSEIIGFLKTKEADG